MGWAQTGIEKNSRGAKHQHHHHPGQQEQTDQPVHCLVNYKKAYDSMPHMNPGMLGTVSTGHHNLYETHLEAYLKPVAQVSVKCGIHVRAIERKNERGALSPLLVLHWAKPSSETITKNGERCWFRSRTTVIHLFYMDKIKLYAKSEQQS